MVMLTLSTNTSATQLASPPQTTASWNVIPSLTFAPAAGLYEYVVQPAVGAAIVSSSWPTPRVTRVNKDEIAST